MPMYVVNSKPSSRSQTDAAMVQFLDEVTEQYLRAVVEKIAIPRHYIAEAENNASVAQWIEDEFKRYGLNVFRQGKYGNVVGLFNDDFATVKLLIGAHFDSVPGSPGADDNASAVAGMLAAAKALAQADNPAVAFVAFNREEDSLLGSKDFVDDYLSNQDHSLELVHILEMIGYCDPSPGAQKLPPRLPIKVSDTGDFLGVIANRDSNRHINKLMKTASAYTPSLPVKGLKVFLGLEKYFHHLLRSDHSPFWSVRIPALMWTDTSEFRNPNYHQASDTPDTLDYRFLQHVTQLLVAQSVDYLQLR